MTDQPPDIVAFFEARLNDDDGYAFVATPGPWSYDATKMWLDAGAFEKYDRSKGEEYVAHGGPHPFTGCVAATGPASHPQSMIDAAFIARHDPARALRQVEAGRRVLARHRPDGSGHCWNCVLDVTIESGSPVVVYAPHPCPDLRAAVAVYSDHPHYDERWRP